MQLTKDQKQVIRAIELHGGITAEMTSRHGWTNAQGVPVGPLRELIDLRIVAPRILTSYPLKATFELREKARDRETHDKIRREAARLGIKEYAPGGFRIHTSEGRK